MTYTRRMDPVVLAVMALGLAVGCGRGGEGEVRHVIELHDRMVREGDGEGYWALFSRRARDEAGQTGSHALDRFTLVARPGYARIVDHVLLRDRTAAVFSHVVAGGTSYHAADRLVREAGGWRIDEQRTSEAPIAPLYFLPPEGGRFLEAGAPWARVAPIEDPEAGRPDQPKASWQIARDEAFVYLRVSYAKELPPPGERLDDPETSLDQLGFGPAAVEAVITRPMRTPERVGVSFEALARRAVRFEPTRTLVDLLDYAVTVEPRTGDAAWTTRVTGQSGDASATLFAHHGNALVVRLPLAALGVGSDANVSLEFGPFGRRTRHASLSF
jgi:hypothetical protein